MLQCRVRVRCVSQPQTHTHITAGVISLKRQRCSRYSSKYWCQAATSNPEALILEADGVIADLHMDGHRVAFNRAFHDLGFDCANWTPAVYHDLLSKGDGTGEGLVSVYYNTVGWPTFLPTSEQQMFAGKVHQLKQKQLRKMLEKGELPLRDGIVQVMSEALASGACLAAITGTASEPDDNVIDYIIPQLPAGVAAGLRVYSASTYSSAAQQAEDDDLSQHQQQQDGSDSSSSSSSSIESSMAAAATRVKQQGAQEFVQRLSQALEGKQSVVPVGIDLALQQGGGSQKGTTAAWLAAVAATLGVPASSCVALASSSNIINAAAAAGMVPIAVPRKMAYAASYPSAAAKFEALGPGYATWQKLAGVWRQQQQKR